MAKIILPLLVVITIIVAGFVILTSRKNEAVKSPLGEKKSILSPTPTVPTDKKYSDEAGFSFSVPGNLEIKKIETKDETVYSTLQITSKDRQGYLSITVTDSQLAKVDDYFKKGENPRKLKLVDIEARQIDRGSKLITVALDQGALFVITADYQNAKAFWLTVDNKVLASFAFAPPQDQTVSTDSGGSAGGDVIDEGEEEIN